MPSELNSELQLRPKAHVFNPAISQPQEGDCEILLLAKLGAQLQRLKLALGTCGVIVDRGGVPRAVRRSAPKNVPAGETDYEIVAAVPGYAIVVISVYALTGGTATTLTFNSKPAGAGAAISPLLANGVNGGEVLPRNIDGWFQTAIGEGLSATTGAGAATGLQVSYILVPNYQTDETGLVLLDETGAPLIEA